MKNLLKRQWPLVGIGVLSAVVVFYLIRAENKGMKAPILKGVFSGEGLKLRDIHYSQNDPDAKLKWILDAKEVKFSGDRKWVHFVDFVLKLKRQDGPPIELKGRKADYSRESGQINLWGNLEGDSGDGYRILTDHMLFNEKERNLSTDERVKIFGPFFLVEGRGLFVDLEKERLTILSDVTTTVNEEPTI